MTWLEDITPQIKGGKRSKACPRGTHTILAALAALAALAGCDGPGWARIEPLTSLSLNESRIFDSVSTSFRASIDRKNRIQPLVVTGESGQLGPSGETVRAWQLLAFVTPSDIPGRVHVVALLGRALPSGQLTWRFFTSQGDVEFWSYANRVMVHGPIQPGDRSATDPVLNQMFSACLSGRVRSGEFRGTVLDMIVLLHRIRARIGPPGRAAESLAAIDDAIEVLQKAVGKGKW